MKGGGGVIANSPGGRKKEKKKEKKNYNDLLIQIMEAKYPFFVYEFRTWYLKISQI